MADTTSNQPTPETAATVPPPPPPAPPVPPVTYASTTGMSVPASALPLSSAGKRLGAYLLDGLLAVVTLGIGWIIWSLVIWKDGYSPAKKMLKMRVIKVSTGQPATFGDMALRELVGKWVINGVTLGITTLVSCFMILGSARQGVWDKIASTVVVDE
jgi:uncharacterized RDD family membrane protein YckC